MLPKVVEALNNHRAILTNQQHPCLISNLIFPENCNAYTTSCNCYRVPSSIRKALDKVCKEAGIKKRITPHSMRRTFNNLQRQAGVNSIALRALTGHSSEKMTEHYSNVNIEEKRKVLCCFK